MKEVDKELKQTFHSDTEGILITRKNNRFIPMYIESDKMHFREYKLLEKV